MSKTINKLEKLKRKENEIKKSEEDVTKKEDEHLKKIKRNKAIDTLINILTKIIDWLISKKIVDKIEK